MRDNKKSTDPGLSAAERKAQRSREAQEAIADLEKAQGAFHENRERLRKERLRREEAAGPMLYPVPELPDDTLIEQVRFSTAIRNALNAAGMKTIGEVREMSDDRALEQAQSRIEAAEDQLTAVEFRAEAAEAEAREARKALALIEETIRRRLLRAASTPQHSAEQQRA